MCQYRGGLIGKHFKVIAQVMSFALMGLVDNYDEIRKGWLLIGELVVKVWHTAINDIDAYIVSVIFGLNSACWPHITLFSFPFQNSLERCILDLLSVLAKCAPGIALTKSKMHFLCHIPFFIRRFGPAILFSSERFESYHKVFRYCSIFSNKLSPSHDIAVRFMHLERARHIATGGLWFDKSLNRWHQASDRLAQFLRDHDEFSRLLGLNFNQPPIPGEQTLYLHYLQLSR